MKKHLIINTLFLAFLAFFVFGIYSCEKDPPEYKTVITVKYLSDTMLIVQGAKVVLEKNDIRDTGTTDAAGQYTTKFKLEAILNVHASIDTGTAGNPHLLFGTSTLRLQENKTVYRTVFVSP